jgi:hypothetical protein
MGLGAENIIRTLARTGPKGALLSNRPGDLARSGIDQMHSLTRGAGDSLVPVLARLNLFGPPALHVLVGVRTTEEEGAHTENGSTTLIFINLIQIKNGQIRPRQGYIRQYTTTIITKTDSVNNTDTPPTT